MTERRIVVEIVGGRTVFKKEVYELPLFEQMGDLSPVIGQYSCAITGRGSKTKKKEPKPREGTLLRSPEGIMYG